jgi:hypothetical protein
MCEHHIYKKTGQKRPLCTLNGCVQPIAQLDKWKRQVENRGKVQAGDLGIIPPR